MAEPSTDKIDMKAIRAISFDLWGTIIKGNPEYKQRRTAYLQQFCDMHGDEIQRIIDGVKKDTDHCVEQFGVHYESEAVHQMILNGLDIKDIGSDTFKTASEQLFMEHPPILIGNAAETLKTLREEGYRIILSSNTVLMNGSVLETVLSMLDIYEYFDMMLFSNELNVSKPNPEFYKHVHMFSGTQRQNIIHVGDNEITDVKGAMNYGINAYHLGKDEGIGTFYTSLKNLRKWKSQE